MKSPTIRRCSKLTKAGNYCRAWALRGSDPLTCAMHAGRVDTAIRPKAGVQGGRTFPFVATAQAVEAPAALVEQPGEWVWTPDRVRPKRGIWPFFVAGALLVVAIILGMVLSQDRTTPTVSISAEPTKVEVGEKVTFTAWASDNRELELLEIWVDGECYSCDPPDRECSKTITFDKWGRVPVGTVR